jgi:sugar fermentation stimulation protein A
MVLQRKDGSIIQTHVPNPGRMEEFCFERQPFFITPVKHTKYPYKVVATTYQDNFVFLDTLKVNTLFFQLLTNNWIPQFQNAIHIKREVTFGDSKFDFAFLHNHGDVIAEIKSCTLCHNTLAMFPDAPTLRGQKHLVSLDRLAREQKYRTYVIFLILNASAERFMPNFHTDFEYGKFMLTADAVNFMAFKLRFIDPVSVDLESIREVPIDVATTQTYCQNKGSYLLLLENSEDRSLTVGKLGDIHFQKGWYVYVGSALNALDPRIQRHKRKRKKFHWHIDYLASTVMPIKKVYPIRRPEKIESQLAQAIEAISNRYIKHFGTSDTHDVSHLFYFKTPPLRNRAFIDIILNAWTLKKPHLT